MNRFLKKIKEPLKNAFCFVNFVAPYSPYRIVRLGRELLVSLHYIVFQRFLRFRLWRSVSGMRVGMRIGVRVGMRVGMRVGVRVGVRGFTLIEMLVAMTIFMLFTGVMISSYVSVIKALKGAEEYRILYSEARHIFDVVTDAARGGTVYPKEWLPCNADFYVDTPSSVVRQIISSNTFAVRESEMEFCAKDGLSKIKFSYDEADSKLVMTEYKRPGLDFDFQSEDVGLYSDEVRVKDFSFYVWPRRDPFSTDSYADENLANLFHPKVTFSAVFEKDNPKGGDAFRLDLQTSISLRTYN